MCRGIKCYLASDQAGGRKMCQAFLCCVPGSLRIEGEPGWVRLWKTALFPLFSTRPHECCIACALPSLGAACPVKVKLGLFGHDENFPAVKWFEDGGLFLIFSHHFDKQPGCLGVSI